MSTGRCEGKRLWIFTGAVPEDGDFALVWADDAREAMAEGRRLAGYADAAEYEDSDFSVDLANAWDILTWAPALINSTASIPVEEDVLDTEDIRAFLTERVRALAER